MNIIVCIDDDKGMMFNNRRQSMDAELRKNLGELVHGKILWMNEYSKAQFKEGEVENIKVSNDYILEAGEDEFCFVENLDVLDNLHISRLIVYKWNRKYPSDKKFEIDMTAMRLSSSIDFTGSSHDRITREIYENEEI